MNENLIYTGFVSPKTTHNFGTQMFHYGIDGIVRNFTDDLISFSIYKVPKVQSPFGIFRVRRNKNAR